ncbi:MAG: major capsid protein, partial [Porphyromonas sp.]|uniref:major capsid protein n=1 Tax=Porphyromonas sp. TaxID=1924944 RepID=UPI002A80574C
MPNLTKYSLDHEVRSSFEMGQLIPFLCQEVVPGDKYRVQSSTLVRLQPMLSPLMHRLDYFQRYYYVPYRLLIPNYEQLLTDPDGKYVVPSMDKYLQYDAHTWDDLFLEKPLLEYFGLATSRGDLHPSQYLKDLNATPLLAYYLIYNHYYMRSDLDKRYVDQLRPENFESAELRKYIGNVMNVNEGLDYFTSAKTSTQYGNMVQLDMNGDNTITVPEMRLAERLQSFRERLLRVGGKYVNYIKEFFGVEPLDARVQIPKYLGGDSYVLNVSDVDQTSPSESGVVGETYGKSVSVNRTGSIQYDVYEHGLIIGLHFVRPRPSNIGGCPKLFTRRNYFDFFNPHFSTLGYQEIESRELDVTRPKTEAFGYVPRYDEYRYGNDVISGDFRRSLNYWHLSRDISQEQLSVPFVTCHPDNRIFNYIGDKDNLLDRYFDSLLVCFVARVSKTAPGRNPGGSGTTSDNVVSAVLTGFALVPTSELGSFLSKIYGAKIVTHRRLSSISRGESVGYIIDFSHLEGETSKFSSSGYDISVFEDPQGFWSLDLSANQGREVDYGFLWKPS